MHRRKYLILIVLLLTGMTIWSCKKDNSNTSITSNSWEVFKLSKQGETTYSLVPNRYILKFINDTTYTLNLDVNTCQGTYKITTDKDIEINPMACTKVCCDSAIAEDLQHTLPEMTEYYVKNKELILTGKKGTVIFKQH